MAKTKSTKLAAMDDSDVVVTPPRPRRDLIGPLILIGLGIVFLLQNFNILPPDFWANIWRYWPVLLILAGLQAIFGDTSVGEITVLLIGIFVIYVILSLALHLPQPQFLRQFSSNLPSTFPQLHLPTPVPTRTPRPFFLR